MTADVRTFDSEEELARAAAAYVGDCLRRAAEARGVATLALAGGSTPRRLYELLATDPWRREAPWRQAEFFWGDERCVGPDDPASNYRMARQALLSRLPLRPAQVHRMAGELADAAAAAAAYEEHLRHFFQHLGLQEPRFDLVLLGLGADGHTASLFPNHPALREQERWVAAARLGGDGPSRLTLTYPVLNRAADILFLVTGAAKAETVRQVLEGPRQPLRLPAQGVQPRAGRLTWFIERPAATRLSHLPLP
ncbi:MAG: 6-phosphogluconolactonase [Candidatus Tectomicrobia bacterium]|nr:6-phosphogluconolactonase [Candidatus Tectomicrobia bacterium]